MLENVNWNILGRLLEHSSQSNDALSKCLDDQKSLRKHEQVEKVVIAQTNTIIDPRTVMVKTFDTNLADGTMLTATRAYTFTLWTQLGAVDDFQQVHEVYVLVHNASWLRA